MRLTDAQGGISTLIGRFDEGATARKETQDQTNWWNFMMSCMEYGAQAALDVTNGDSPDAAYMSAYHKCLQRVSQMTRLYELRQK
jgi:hypothetical protein